MALAGTLISGSPNKKIWTVTGLDADVTLTLTHGMPGTPQVYVTPNNTTIAAAALFGAVGSSSSIVLTKATSAGSGGATPGTSVICTIVAELNPQG